MVYILLLIFEKFLILDSFSNLIVNRSVREEYDSNINKTNIIGKGKQKQ
jgi:hypothetical protein